MLPSRQVWSGGGCASPPLAPHRRVVLLPLLDVRQELRGAGSVNMGPAVRMGPGPSAMQGERSTRLLPSSAWPAPPTPPIRAPLLALATHLAVEGDDGARLARLALHPVHRHVEVDGWGGRGGAGRHPALEGLPGRPPSQARCMQQPLHATPAPDMMPSPNFSFCGVGVWLGRKVSQGSGRLAEARAHQAELAPAAAAPLRCAWRQPPAPPPARSRPQPQQGAQ